MALNSLLSRIFPQRAHTVVVDRMATAVETTTHLAAREGLRASAAEQYQQMFFAAMVHQLKTPLQIISGNADNLVSYWERLPSEDRVAMMFEIIAGVHDMAELIDRNMDVVRSESDGWRAEISVIEDVEKQVESLVHHLQDTVPTLEYVGTGTPIHPVNADSRVLGIILKTLIENAQQHGVSTCPILVTVHDSDRHVNISVTNWTSCSDKLTDGIFQRGYRGKESMGTGLGLWIVHNYAVSMSGEINHHQECDERGTRVTFGLSLPKATVISICDREYVT